jgi:formate dehydrogenase maturation protein FdhE
MNKRLQDMEQKVQEKDKLLNDMAMALKSQQDVLVNTPPPEVQGSEAERNQPMTKGDFFQIIKDGIQLLRQQTAAPDPRIERAIDMQDKLVDAMWEKMARALISDKDAAPGVS